MPRTRGLECALLGCLLGCAKPDADASEGDESDGGASESDSTGDLPSDLPAEPECPAGLGEVVICECAVVEGCATSNATECAFSCELPSPCPTVTCFFNSSVDSPSCVDELDTAALQCVFDELAKGQPMRWSTRLRDTYFNAWDDTQYEFLRLDATSYVVRNAYEKGNDAGASESGEGFLGRVVPESAWMQCDAAESDQARFDCLHKLVFKGEACTDPAALACP